MAEPLSAYELQRQENIRRNNEQLALLGLADGTAALLPKPPPAKERRTAVKRERARAGRAEPQEQPPSFTSVPKHIRC